MPIKLQDVIDLNSSAHNLKIDKEVFYKSIDNKLLSNRSLLMDGSNITITTNSSIYFSSLNFDERLDIVKELIIAYRNNGWIIDYKIKNSDIEIIFYSIFKKDKVIDTRPSPLINNISSFWLYFHIFLIFALILSMIRLCWHWQLSTNTIYDSVFNTILSFAVLVSNYFISKKRKLI